MAFPSQDDDQAQPFLSTDGPLAQDVELSQLDGGVATTRTAAEHYGSNAKTVGWRSALTITAAMTVAVVCFVINIEASEWFEIVLGWKKPFATMYITHSSLTLPWIVHIIYLRFRDRKKPYGLWVRDYNNQLRGSISTVQAYVTDAPYLIWKRNRQLGGPLDYLSRAMLIVAAVLTMSGVSWFLASSLTTPGDLTAIYNGSTFFAAVFSVPILRERIGRRSILAVALSLIGTFVITYGDSTARHEIKAGTAADTPISHVGASRFVGNLIACAGAAAFGMYEVLFKRWACSSAPMQPAASLPLSLAANALTGLWTFGLFWILLVVLHIFSIETFVWPNAQQALYIVMAVLSGSISISLIAIITIWTTPVFASFANVLSMFLVVLADWLLFGIVPAPAAFVGGALIIVAFTLLAWDTFREPGNRGRRKDIMYERVNQAITTGGNESNIDNRHQ